MSKPSLVSLMNSLFTGSADLRILMLPFFISALTPAIVIPFLSIFMRRQLNLTPADVGAFFSLYFLFNLVFQIPAGIITDRWSKKSLLIFSDVSSAGFAFALAYVNNAIALYLVVAGMGLVGALSSVTTQALVTDLVEEQYYSRAIGLWRVAYNAAWALGPPLGGFLIGIYAFGFAFSIAGLCSLAGAMALLFLIKNPQRSGKEPASQAINLAFLSRLLSWDFGILCLVTFLGIAVYANLDTLFPAFASASGISDPEVGLLFSLNAIMVLLFQMPITTWIDKVPRKRSILLGLTLMIAGFSGLAFLSTFLGVAILIGVLTLGELFFHPATAAFVADIAPAEEKGRYFGLYGVFVGLGMSVGPFISGRAWDLGGKPGPWYLSFVIGVLALAIGSLLKAFPKRAFQQERMPTP